MKTRPGFFKPSADATRKDDGDGLRRALLKWGAVFGVWTFFGCLNASQIYLGLRAEGFAVSFWKMLITHLLGWWSWACLTPLILWLGRRFPIERAAWARGLSIHLVACALFAAVHSAFFTCVSILIVPFGAFSNPRPFAEMFLGHLTSQLQYDLLIYGSILGISYAFSYYERYREREFRASQLEMQLAQAQLQALKMQLHPHFLFNTLNGIAGLVRDSRNKAAVDMLVGLSDLLRYTLENAGKQEVPLREELEFLGLYLDIQLMRFPDRLKVEMNAPPETLDALVPNLILQPLVENAIRHGVAPRASAGTVGVSASRVGGSLRITVYDDGLGLRANVQEGGTAGSDGGIGLANTRSRLRQLYGDGHQFTLANRVQGGVEATLLFPFRKVSAGEGDE